MGGESGLLDVRDRALKPFGPPAKRGQATAKDIWDGFVDKVLSFVDVSAIKPLQGRASTRRTGWPARCCRRCSSVCRSTPSPATSSRTGASRTTSRTRCCRRTASSSSRKTLEEHADLGVAYDGDADRCFFVDDTGEFVPGDFVTALLAESILREGAAAAASSTTSVRAAPCPQTIERAGGTALINRVGHAYIKHRMRKEGAVFGGEVSAHYYFRDFSQADSGVVPFLLLLELISRSGRKLSEILAPYREQFFLTGEINTPVADVPPKLQELKERYADGTVTHLDGISVDYDDWHFNVRPSNTEPLLRLNLEAFSQEQMERKRDEVLDLIRS